MDGLTHAEAAARLRKHGPNRLSPATQGSVVLQFLAHFRNPLVLVLLAASGISALTGERTPRLLEVVDRVATERRKRVPTPGLNRFIAAITEAHPPVSDARRAVRILFASQTGVAPPTFVLFTNIRATMHFSYLRYLTNRLRDEYGFAGTPIKLHIRPRTRKGSAPEGA